MTPAELTICLGHGLMIHTPDAGIVGRIPPRWDRLSPADRRHLSGSLALEQRQRQGLPARLADRDFLTGLGRVLDVVFDADAIGHVEGTPLHGRAGGDCLESPRMYRRFWSMSSPSQRHSR